MNDYKWVYGEPFFTGDKKATYQARYLQSDAYTKAMEAKRIVVHEFGTVGTPDPCINSFKRYTI